MIPDRNMNVSRAVLIHHVHEHFVFWTRLNALLQTLPVDLPGKWALVQDNQGVEVQVALSDGRDYAVWTGTLYARSAVALGCVTGNGWIRHLYRIDDVLVCLCIPMQPGTIRRHELGAVWADFIETLGLDKHERFGG